MRSASFESGTWLPSISTCGWPSAASRESKNLSSEVQIRESGDFRLGVKTRFFNYNLESALSEKQKALGVPRYQLCKLMGVNYQTLARYLSLKNYPSEKILLKISSFLVKPPDHLFPDHLKEVRLKRQPEPLALTAEDWTALGYMQPVADPGEALEHEELTALVRQTLKTLTAREAKVIALRFGIEEERAYTMEEVAEEYGLTRARIYQIERNALRKLRHPSRSRELRGVRGKSPLITSTQDPIEPAKLALRHIAGGSLPGKQVDDVLEELGEKLGRSLDTNGKKMFANIQQAREFLAHSTKAQRDGLTVLDWALDFIREMARYRSKDIYS